MTDFDGHDCNSAPVASGMAILLLQLAASQAEIGPFAKRGCETPQIAARLYRAGVSAGRARPRPHLA